MFRQKTYHLTLEKLFSVLFFLSLSISLKAQTLIINEVSNGPAGSQEYVEFVVIDTAIAYDCNGSTPPCVDIRGWIFDDNSGYHGAGGVASGAVRFSQDPLWSCVPVGTIILIYNSADPNTSLPANDVTMSDNNCRIVALCLKPTQQHPARLLALTLQQVGQPMETGPIPPLPTQEIARAWWMKTDVKFFRCVTEAQTQTH
jgi:hypothetical protein